MPLHVKINKGWIIAKNHTKRLDRFCLRVSARTRQGPDSGCSGSGGPVAICGALDDVVGPFKPCT